MPRRLVAEDGVNLIIFRAESWCHNERCGGASTFPLRAAAMTTTFPKDARGSDVREGDIEINAVNGAWLARQVPTQPNLSSVLLHEIGHILGFPDWPPLPEGMPLDSVMRQGSMAEGITELDVKAICTRFPR